MKKWSLMRRHSWLLTSIQTKADWDSGCLRNRHVRDLVGFGPLEPTSCSPPTHSHSVSVAGATLGEAGGGGNEPSTLVNKIRCINVLMFYFFLMHIKSEHSCVTKDGNYLVMSSFEFLVSEQDVVATIICKLVEFLVVCD